MTDTHKGSCHCGAVSYEVDACIDHVVDCNCSICRRCGALWHGVANDSLRILTGEQELTLYQFNTMSARHYFCRTCGVHPFVRPRLKPDAWGINVRCLDGVDLALLPVEPFDGKNWEPAAQAFLQG
jgi:hypothetical protein